MKRPSCRLEAGKAQLDCQLSGIDCVDAASLAICAGSLTLVQTKAADNTPTTALNAMSTRTSFRFSMISTLAV